MLRVFHLQQPPLRPEAQVAEVLLLHLQLQLAQAQQEVGGADVLHAFPPALPRIMAPKEGCQRRVSKTDLCRGMASAAKFMVCLLKLNSALEDLNSLSFASTMHSESVYDEANSRETVLGIPR